MSKICTCFESSRDSFPLLPGHCSADGGHRHPRSDNYAGTVLRCSDFYVSYASVRYVLLSQLYTNVTYNV